jgi:hypothetical protein
MYPAAYATWKWRVGLFLKLWALFKAGRQGQTNTERVKQKNVANRGKKLLLGATENARLSAGFFGGKKVRSCDRAFFVLRGVVWQLK